MMTVFQIRDRVMLLVAAIMVGVSINSGVSCASMKALDVGPIDSEFDSYVDEYRELKKKKTGKDMNESISILFHSLSGTTIGVCYAYNNGDREIYIDPSYWYSDYTTDKDRKLLILHELGHCDLHRGHTDPSTIMEVYHIGGYEFGSKYSYYTSELFDESLRKDMTVSFKQKAAQLSGKSCGGIVLKKGKKNGK